MSHHSTTTSAAVLKAKTATSTYLSDWKKKQKQNTIPVLSAEG
jgi:hypothetical protein